MRSASEPVKQPKVSTKQQELPKATRAHRELIPKVLSDFIQNQGCEPFYEKFLIVSEYRKHRDQCQFPFGLHDKNQ